MLGDTAARWVPRSPEFTEDAYYSPYQPMARRKATVPSSIPSFDQNAHKLGAVTAIGIPNASPAAPTVGQGIGNLRSDDAHEDHGQPISPRDVLPRSELQEQRSDQQSRHDAICQGGSETDMHRQVARTGLAHSSRHDLDDPEGKRDFPGLCSA
jgi:hypothetical protein